MRRSALADRGFPRNDACVSCQAAPSGAAADERDAREDQRARELAGLASSLEAAARRSGESSAQKVSLSRDTLARTRELLEAVRERVAHAGAARNRALAHDERQIAGIEREILSSINAPEDGAEARRVHMENLQVRADDLRRHERRLRQQAAALDTLKARRAVADTHVHVQLRRAARLRRELASVALAIAAVEDEVAVNLDTLAARTSPARARSRSDGARHAREFAEQERNLAERYSRSNGGRDPDLG